MVGVLLRLAESGSFSLPPASRTEHDLAPATRDADPHAGHVGTPFGRRHNWRLAQSDFVAPLGRPALRCL
eukprot:5037958-Lingulodinium_polyedra.AAC.1